MEKLIALYNQFKDTDLEESAQEILDDMVHTIKENNAIDTNPFDPDNQVDDYENHLATFSNEASDINNNGPTSQIEFIAAQGCADDLESSLNNIQTN